LALIALPFPFQAAHQLCHDPLLNLNFSLPSLNQIFIRTSSGALPADLLFMGFDHVLGARQPFLQIAVAPQR